MSPRRLAVVLLLGLFAQMAFSARELSLTYDEPLHIAVGYTDWVTGDPGWHEIIGHPPLIILWNTLPLLLEPGLPDPRPFIPMHDWPALFTALAGPQAERLLRITLLTRLPVMGLTLILAAFVYRWAQQSWGGYAGLLALGWLTFDPGILAHGILNTTDLGVTACGFIACYALARYGRAPGRWRYLAAGLALGAVLSSKASGVFWVGVFGLSAGLYWLTDPQTPRLVQKLRASGAWAMRLSGWVILALLILWASYLFEVRPLTPGGLPIPAASHWAPLPRIGKVMTRGMTTFFAGERIEGGHWAYFPVMLLIKTPLVQLLALALTVWSMARKGSGSRWANIPLLITPVAYLIIAIRSSLNIGHRHVLPMLPYLFVLMGSLAGRARLGALVRRRWQPALALALCVGYVGGTLAVFPHYLAYFNLSIGGADNGYRYLADSSVDWGQNFQALKKYLTREQLENVRLAAFTSIDPALYHFPFTPIPPTAAEPITLTARFNPAPGTYVISTLPLQGVWVLDPDTYDWFRHRPPTDKIGHGLFVYHVTPPTPTPTWVAQCALPYPPLEPSQITEGLGMTELRTAAFDCAQSWLYPAGAAGWVVLPETGPDERWNEERLRDVPLSFQQGALWKQRALRLYLQTQPPPGATPSHAQPIQTDGPLSLLGYDLVSTRQSLEVDTYWRVEALTGRMLSLMGHLVRSGDGMAVIKDGLGVPIEYWRVGDVIVQRHVFAIPTEAPPGRYTVFIGAYWLDTMERWRLENGSTELTLPEVTLP